jgi:hypothetical protein
VAVIQAGRIAELGTHDQLIEKRGIYFKLASRQLDQSREWEEDNVLPLHRNGDSLKEHESSTGDNHQDTDLDDPKSEKEGLLSKA